MGKLVVQMQLSIDGYVARSRDEDFSWILPTLDSDYETWGVPALWAAGFHVMGADTGKGLAEYWPTSTDPYAPAMNEVPKVVFSKTLQSLDWQNTTIVAGDLAEEIGKLKAATDKQVLVHGGVKFVHSLIRLGLPEEYHLVTHPAAIGSGLPFFPELEGPVFFDLIETRAFRGGAVLHVYRPRQ
jgi:dihydrofolate reductase